jgi:hypothetical protein
MNMIRSLLANRDRKPGGREIVMNSVSVVGLGERIIGLLDAKEGDVLELGQLRDGSIRLRRVET